MFAERIVNGVCQFLSPGRKCIKNPPPSFLFIYELGRPAVQRIAELNDTWCVLVFEYDNGRRIGG